MTGDMNPGISIKRFATIYLVVGLLYAVVFYVLTDLLGLSLNPGSGGLVTPTIAALLAGEEYGARAGDTLSSRAKWKSALTLTGIHMVIQIVLAAGLTMFFLPDYFALFLSGDQKLIGIILGVIVVIFLLSWALIRFGLALGIKSGVRRAARQGPKS